MLLCGTSCPRSDRTILKLYYVLQNNLKPAILLSNMRPCRQLVLVVLAALRLVARADNENWSTRSGANARILCGGYHRGGSPCDDHGKMLKALAKPAVTPMIPFSLTHTRIFVCSIIYLFYRAYDRHGCTNGEPYKHRKDRCTKV